MAQYRVDQHEYLPKPKGRLMDDFTKKDKYNSLNSAIKDIVQQNNDLYQKSLREKYGFKQEQPVEKTEVNEEVEQLVEATSEQKIKDAVMGELESMGRKKDKVLQGVTEIDRNTFVLSLEKRFGKSFHQELAKQLRATLKNHTMSDVSSVGVYKK